MKTMTMNYIEAPDEFRGSGPAVFLAGGISDTDDWQSHVVRSLQDLDVAVLNPRWAQFPQGDAEESRRQIAWEHRHLERADLVAFWFPPQTLCPIALFELGACCTARIPLIIGAHPSYGRRFDLESQLALRRPDVKIACTLQEFTEQIHGHPALRGGL
jgi:hypothetical protein